MNKFKEENIDNEDIIRVISEYLDLKDEIQKIVSVGDKENANKDSKLNSTSYNLIAEAAMRFFFSGKGRLKDSGSNEGLDRRILKKEWIEAHDQGYIYIHDLGARYRDQINCCLFDMGNVLKDGFELNGVRYFEPKTIQSALNVASDVVISASSNQYGGQM